MQKVEITVTIIIWLILLSNSWRIMPSNTRPVALEMYIKTVLKCGFNAMTMVLGVI